MTDFNALFCRPIDRVRRLITSWTSLLAVFVFSNPLVQAAATPPVYMKIYNDGVEEVQWTEQAGHLVGSFQLVYVTKTTPPSLRAENRTFVGERSGTTLSLVFEQPFMRREVWAGALVGNQLTLNVPQSSGGLRSTVLKKTNALAYNRVVEQLRNAVASATAQIQAQRAKQQALDQAARAKQDEIDRQSRAVKDDQDGVNAILKGCVALTSVTAG